MIPFIVFGLSRSRLPLYLLPLFPALALITGRLMARVKLSRIGICLLALWLIALVAMKWGASRYSYLRDIRPLAHDIVQVVSPFHPSEILFVETDPLWGLGLYLNCEVERVMAAPPRTRDPQNQETLAQELSSEEPGTLIMVSKSEKRRVERLLYQIGYHGEGIAVIRSWALIRPQRSKTASPDLKELRGTSRFAHG